MNCASNCQHSNQNRSRRGKGSHEIWFGPVTKRAFTVAVTVNNRHTANGILKQAGIDKRL